MGRIVVSANVSLDGIVQDPDGQEGFRRGGWFGRFGGEDLEEWAEAATAETLGADALLMGRRSEEFFAARWQSRTGTWADRLNGLPKYVVSSGTAPPRWSNSTLIGADVVDRVPALAREVDGEILVYASARLVHALLEHGLVDELRLVVFPVLLGDGARLFGPTTDRTPLRLVRVGTLGKGLAVVTYEVVRSGLPGAAPVSG
ncbi:dihydrofolate reductase family protein [Actinomycetospora sp. TBRC 11914]|uniref:dihydrofolate reductase family protein n=1 Tax=Actinomycetospora sp. TBRC 11914 TaxID=2729387 RepID=UPI00145E1451|nr:dihydrofolate reductase family protein [Actinomycetospora sp. TBRC 11914]NMO93569.1 dihydrofolate reductase family protein [Actinomycetospora sp. TBRC 11914]